MEKIAIAGGSGLIGQALIPVLQSAGFDAFALRRPYTPDSLSGVTTIINLPERIYPLADGLRSEKRRLLKVV